MSVDEVLALIGFSTEFLPHPAALLTIEQASNVAGVPKTTVDSAVSGSNQFREMVVAEAIGQLQTQPGPETWQALRKGLRGSSLVETVALVLDARASELADDPAFALFLGGYDCLEKERVAAVVDVAASEVVRRFVPFIETAVATFGDDPLVSVGADQAFLMLHVLLTEAYRRLPGCPRPEPAADATLTQQSAALIVDEFASVVEATVSGAWDTFLGPPFDSHVPPVGRLATAVRAGAGLLLSGAVPVSMRLTIGDVTAATGLSTAAIYRRFGSLADLERALLERVGREILVCFEDDFFDSLLERVRSGAMPVGEAFSMFTERAAAEVADHIERGRPDRQIIPWMQHAATAEIFRNAYRAGYQLRGAFYEEFGALLGLRPADTLCGADVSAILSAHSVISELILRRAPDRETASAVMHTRFPRINARLFT
ncbi:MAG: TetR/AcrR family transcriptional regulator [Acidimicrobiales bacterium]